MVTAADFLAESKRLAEGQARAYERMLELDGGVGKLGVEHPEMFEDMLAWIYSTDNEHADIVLRLVRALEAVLVVCEEEWAHSSYGSGGFVDVEDIHRAIESALAEEGEGDD